MGTCLGCSSCKCQLFRLIH
ncbi:hypothetical protein V2J09_012752, partial [Rumex salicifolius]